MRDSGRGGWRHRLGASQGRAARGQGSLGWQDAVSDGTVRSVQIEALPPVQG